MRHVIIIGIGLLFCVTGLGQVLKSIQKGAIINGHIEDGKKGDTLYLMVYAGTYSDNIVFNSDPHSTGISFFTAVTGDKGSFHFELPRFSIHQIKITLNLKEGLDERVILPMSPFNNHDSLKIRATRGSHMFGIDISGRGAAKYNAKFRITRAFYHFRDSIDHQQLKKSLFLPEEMNEIFHQSAREGLNQLDRFKNRIDNTTFQILRLDLLGDAHNWWLEKLANLNKGYSPDQQMAAQTIFERAVRRDSRVAPEIAELSINYLFLIYNMTIDQLRLQRPLFDSATIRVKLCEIYDQLVTNYRGQLRENLVFQLLRYNPDMYLPLYDSTTVPFWKKAYSLFTNPALKAYAWKRIHFTQPGFDVYPFAFPDSTGQMVKLEQFKGKTILIDVWFTGCRGCLAYADWLKKEIYPVFDKDTNIVFISISGDISRNTWLSSIHSGRYTRPRNVNVYTGGLGFTDPFMKYYDFQGGPYALLIDKNGKFYSADLPMYNAEKFIPILRVAMQ
jgi:hypothetical protein